MNKQALKLKKKRRAEKRAAIEQEKERFLKNFEKKAAENPFKEFNKNYDKDLVWSMSKRLEKELTVKSIMCCIMATMYCLNRTFKWGKERLYEYGGACVNAVTAVGTQERTIDKLAEELKLDAGVDIFAMLDGYKPFNGIVQYGEKQNEAVCLLHGIKRSMIIALYELYNNPKWRWKKIRMNRIAEAVKEIVIDALEHDRMDSIREFLDKKIGIKVSYSGRIEIKE